MSAVEVTITGMLYDRLNRTTQNVVLIGEATLTGLGVGGGPIVPPSGGGQPPNWSPIHPSHPIANPFPPYVDIGGPGPQPPIVPVPPTTPNVPPPGSPPVMVSGAQPVNPMTPPPAVIIEYPGVGKVIVPLPTATAPPPA